MIAKEVKNLLGILCTDRLNLDDQLLPFKASTYYNQQKVRIHTYYVHTYTHTYICTVSRGGWL